MRFTILQDAWFIHLKQMQKQYVSVWGDWLHFNDTGYKFVGKTVYDKLKTMLD